MILIGISRLLVLTRNKRPTPVTEAWAALSQYPFAFSVDAVKALILCVPMYVASPGVVYPSSTPNLSKRLFHPPLQVRKMYSRGNVPKESTMGLEFDIILLERLVIFNDSRSNGGRSFCLHGSLRSCSSGLLFDGLGVWNVFLEEAKETRPLLFLGSSSGRLSCSLCWGSCFSWCRGFRDNVC